MFDPTRPLHLLKGEEDGHDIHQFVYEVQRRTGRRPRFIAPDELRLVPSEVSRFGYKLCCLAPAETANDCTASSEVDEPTKVTSGGEILEEIEQIGVELHQRELRAMSPEMLRQLALRCFNDLRTVLLVHDKRMLGIVLQELEALVSKHQVLTRDQARILQSGIAPSMLPGSTELIEFTQRCMEAPGLRNEYLLKPIRSGKGAGIVFGDEVSEEDWQSMLQGLQTPALTPGLTSYIVQRQVQQPKYEVLLQEKDGVQHNRLIGTYLSVNGQFLGMGLWRSGPSRICAISHGGSFLYSVLGSQHAQKGEVTGSRLGEWLESIGCWIRARVKRRKFVD